MSDTGGVYFFTRINVVHFQDPNYIAAIHTDSPKAVILDIRCVKLIDIGLVFLCAFGPMHWKLIRQICECQRFH